MERIFKKPDWTAQGRGINRLRVADEVVLLSELVNDLQQSINDLKRENLNAELKMNEKKTKVTFTIHSKSSKRRYKWKR